MVTKKAYTDKQGQYLAFIYYYTKLNGRAPAEADMERYFRVTPPSVHSKVVRLAQLGLVSRQHCVPRSIRVAIPESEIPALENGPGSVV